jgi:hypothetical protein
MSQLFTHASEIFETMSEHLSLANKRVFKRFKIFRKYVDSLRSDTLYEKYSNWKTLITQIKMKYKTYRISFFADVGFVLTYSNHFEDHKHIFFSMDSDEVSVYSSRDSSLLGTKISDVKRVFDVKCVFENPNRNESQNSSVIKKLWMEQILRLIFLRFN